jgi:hypothetical protein
MQPPTPADTTTTATTTAERPIPQIQPSPTPPLPPQKRISKLKRVLVNPTASPLSPIIKGYYHSPISLFHLSLSHPSLFLSHLPLIYSNFVIANRSINLAFSFQSTILPATSGQTTGSVPIKSKAETLSPSVNATSTG